MKYLIIGDIFHSTSMYVKEFPNKDREANVERMFNKIGSGAVVGGAISRYLGIDVTLMSKLDSSERSTVFYNKLKSLNIDVSYLEINDITPNSLLTIYDSNQCRISFSFNNNSITDRDLSKIDFSRFDAIFIYFQHYEIAKKIYDYSFNLNTNIVLVPSGFIDEYFLGAKLKIRPKFLFINANELTSVTKTNSVVDALNTVGDENQINIISTLGPEGYFCYCDGNLYQEKVSAISNIVHYGGAGDAAAVGFVTSYLKNLSISDCCQLAHKMASKILQVIDPLSILEEEL